MVDFFQHTRLDLVPHLVNRENMPALSSENNKRSTVAMIWTRVTDKKDSGTCIYSLKELDRCDRFAFSESRNY
jgi:hypothetical protein